MCMTEPRKESQRVFEVVIRDRDAAESGDVVTNDLPPRVGREAKWVIPLFRG